METTTINPVHEAVTGIMRAKAAQLNAFVERYPSIRDNLKAYELVEYPETVSVDHGLHGTIRLHRQLHALVPIGDLSPGDKLTPEDALVTYPCCYTQWSMKAPAASRI